MASSKFESRVLDVLKSRKLTASEIASEIGEAEEAIKPVLLAMDDSGMIRKEADFYFTTEEGKTSVEEKPGFVILPIQGKDEAASPKEEDVLSEQEWMVIRLLLTKKGQPFHLSEVARNLGDGPAKAAVAHLIKLGIVEKAKDRYRITATSALNIPLSTEEKEKLGKLEGEIDGLVEAIEENKHSVAENLKIIRDQKLYRATHKRFNDYVGERFERTRDWAYKMIQYIEVTDGLQEGENADVEAILQTLTTREVPHLAKLKKEPAKMQKALLKADETAKSKDRPRTVEDVMKAVASFQPKKEAKKEPEAAPKKLRTVTFKGIEYDGGETDDLPAYLRTFAGWLEKHPCEAAFSIKVSKAA